MSRRHLVTAWGRILTGRQPVLSIEITRECPLRCAGCYAYEPEHLGAVGPLRSLADYRGQELVDRVLALVEEQRPVHVSIVGGEPLVRFRELDVLLPRLSAMGLMVQVVTSAVRPIPPGWTDLPGVTVAVSIDGLRPEHDARRAPATYDRILKNIVGHRITVHCTVTRQMASRPGSLDEFLAFWSDQPQVARAWFSLFTPQRGAVDAEILPPEEKEAVLRELARLRPRYPKLQAPDLVLDGYRKPPASPRDCIFARTTRCVTADLESTISPCQFGGDPDCSQCGCMASAGLASLAGRRLAGVVTLGGIYEVSDRIGRVVRAGREGAARLRAGKPSPSRETVTEGAPAPDPVLTDARESERFTAQERDLPGPGAGGEVQRHVTHEAAGR